MASARFQWFTIADYGNVRVIRRALLTQTGSGGAFWGHEDDIVRYYVSGCGAGLGRSAADLSTGGYRIRQISAVESGTELEQPRSCLPHVQAHGGHTRAPCR